MSAVTNRAFSRLASLLLAALLIFTAGVLSAPPARADDGGSLSGTVTDEAGSPVGSVWVTVYGYDAEYDYWDYRGSTSSSEDGIYEVTGLAAGDYKVQFMTEGASANVVGEWWDDAVSQDAATLVSVSAGSTTPGISPRLAPAGSLSGTVADEDDSSIGNVEVTVYGYNAVDDYWDHRGAAYTAEDGTYTVRGLPAGEYKIEFRTWDATVNVVGEWWDDAASQDEAALVAVSAGATTSGISPRLAAAGEVSGTVTDEDENPVGDVTVTVYSYDPENEYWAYRGYAHTAEDGTYTVKGLAAGEYKFDFWTGNATANVVGEWWDDAMSEATADVIAVSAGATTSGISPRLAAAGAVSGTVTDEDGNPVEGVNVYASGYDAANDYWEYRGQASTSEDGTYVVRGLPAGEYKIEFTTQYASANVVGEWWDDAASLDAATSISVTAGGTTDGISPQLAFAGAVSGTVEDEHGNPAQAVEVVAYVEDDDYWSWHSSTGSADDGTYLLSGLPANHYKLEFRTENASENLVSEWWDDAANEEQASTVTVASGTTTSGISPQLAAGGNITGKVTDQHGSGVPDISVNVSSSHPDSDFYAYGQSSDDGEYVVRGLPAGDYLVHFGGTDGVVGEWWDDARSQSDAKAVAVSAGSVTSNISPELAPTGRIAGVVSDESGNPVSGVEVRVALVGSTPFDGGERSDWTGEDGSYEVRGLSAGEYTVHFLTWEASQNVLDEWWDDAETKASSTTVTVKEGATTSGVSPQLANGGEISGTVVDGDGDPMKYFGVRAYLGDASTPTSYGHASEDGSFTIRGLRTGEYKLLFNGQNSSGPTLVEWWSNAADRSSALPVAVDDGGTTGGIAIVLG